MRPTRWAFNTVGVRDVRVDVTSAESKGRVSLLSLLGGIKVSRKVS